jgi:hypothetical protein
MVARGEITEARGRIMNDRFEKLLTIYRGQMGEAAARAEASFKTIDQLEAEALLKKRQELLQVSAQRRIEGELTGFAGGGHNKWRTAALALFDRDWQGRATYSNVEERRFAILAQAHAMLEGVLEKHSRGFLSGAVRAKADLVDLARVAFGEATDNESARGLGEAWTQAADWLRQRFNAAGGNIGKLEKWGFPQHHNSAAVREAASADPAYRALEADLVAARAAKDAAAEARIGAAMVARASETWREFVTPRLDRAAMIDRETGLPFTDEALQEALDGVFRTIRTDGWEGRSLGAMGGGKLANRHDDARFLMFRDSDAWLDYHDRFGTGTVFDVMMNHIEGMSRDVAHLELLGPNPSATVKWLNDLVESKRQLTPDSEAKGQRPGGFFLSIDQMYAASSGALSAAVDPTLARRMGSVRSLLTAAQLGSATLSAITDVGWQAMARFHRGMPITGMARDLAMQFAKTERREAVRTGLIADEASSLLAAQNRFVAQEVVGRKSAWLAERVLKLSLLSPWTQAGKWSWGRGVQSALGGFADRPLEQVPEKFQRMLREYGVDSGAWEKIRATPLDDDGFLSPIDIADQALRDRMLGMITMESLAAIPSATLTSRAIGLGSRPGTLGGEVLRSAFQYKSFGVSLLLVQGGRTMSIKGGGNKLAYLAGVNAVGMSLGLLVLWLRDVRNGDDPREIGPASLGQAWTQGVGFGVFGDYITAATSERAGSWPAALAGPTAGAMGEAGEFVIGNAVQTGKWALDRETKRDGTPKSWNEQTKAGREAVRMMKRYAPGTNLWYARLAAERLMFDQMQQLFDPGYEDSWKAIERARAEEGHPVWWHRGELTPERAPDPGNVAGGAAAP